MPAIGPTQIGIALVTFALISAFWGMILGWAWLIWRIITGQSILPERPLVNRGEPPWRGGTVCLILSAYLLVNFVVMLGYPLVRNLLPDRPAEPVAKDKNQETKPDAIASTAAPESKVPAGAANEPVAAARDDDKKMPLSHSLFINGLVDVLMLGVIPGVARLTSDARLRNFGLSFEGWYRQAAVGVVATLIATPPVTAIQFVAARIWDPQAHPLQEMMFREFTLGMAGLAVITAVVVAPLFEELAFRALLQTWIVNALLRSAKSFSGDLAIVDRAPADVAASSDQVAAVWESEVDYPDAGSYKPPKAPDSTQAATKPADDSVFTPTSLGILLTSLLFAAVHFGQWPAPVALCMLAMVIGAVYQKTGSLITAVIMHATFNGLNTLLLLLALLSGVDLEPDQIIK